MPNFKSLAKAVPIIASLTYGGVYNQQDLSSVLHEIWHKSIPQMKVKDACLCVYGEFEDVFHKVIDGLDFFENNDSSAGMMENDFFQKNIFIQTEMYVLLSQLFGANRGNCPAAEKPTVVFSYISKNGFAINVERKKDYDYSCQGTDSLGILLNAISLVAHADNCKFLPDLFQVLLKVLYYSKITDSYQVMLCLNELESSPVAADESCLDALRMMKARLRFQEQSLSC